MPVPLIVAGAALAVGAGAKAYGNHRAKKAAQKAQRQAESLQRKGEAQMDEAWKKRTNYEIPKEIQDQYNLAGERAFAKSDIQTGMENSADRGLSNNLSAIRRYATSSNDALAAVSGAYGANQEGYNQAATAGAEQKQQNMAQYYQQGSQMGDYKNLMYDMNVNVPFLQRMEFAQGMIGAGFQGSQNARMAQAGLASDTGHAIGDAFTSFAGMYAGGMGGGGQQRPALSYTPGKPS
jgi:hypothetical protein